MTGIIRSLFGGSSSRTVATPVSNKTTPAKSTKPAVTKTNSTATAVLPGPSSSSHHHSMPTTGTSPIAASLGGTPIASFSLPSSFQIPGPVEPVCIGGAAMDMLVEATNDPEKWKHDSAMAVAEILVEEHYIQVAPSEIVNMKNKIYHFMMLPGTQSLITYLWSTEDREIISFGKSSLDMLLSFIQENRATIIGCDFDIENSKKYLRYDSISEYKSFLSHLKLI